MFTPAAEFEMDASYTAHRTRKFSLVVRDSQGLESAGQGRCRRRPTVETGGRTVGLAGPLSLHCLRLGLGLLAAAVAGLDGVGEHRQSGRVVGGLGARLGVDPPPDGLELVELPSLGIQA